MLWSSYSYQIESDMLLMPIVPLLVNSNFGINVLIWFISSNGAQWYKFEHTYMVSVRNSITTWTTDTVRIALWYQKISQTYEKGGSWHCSCVCHLSLVDSVQTHQCLVIGMIVKISLFLAATKQLYKWYFPSVRPSVRLSVCHTFLTMFPSSYHHEIFRSYYQWPK